MKIYANYKKNPTLNDFNIYLKEKFDDFNDEKDENDKNEKNEKENPIKKIIAIQKREKIIYLLKQFIVFLNHQSAGAPSKIATYFENYVVTKEMFSNWDKYDIGIIAGNKDSNNLFLFFDYYSQYELGLISYLISPFNYTINKAIRNYSDKLIVSASFLHNHLFKFHRNAFSWRDIEAAPEMIDINKNPELRDFLSRLLEFLLGIHLQEIVIGIYAFKFPKRISQEMLFLSHVSEGASASFNFTLDESLNVKHHYKDLLTNLKNNININNNDQLIVSISSIYITLGDLSFYDGDYGEAILYYQEAIQETRNLPIEKITVAKLVTLTRNMLKLGHALEKRKTYDSAFQRYSEIINIIIKVFKHYNNIKDIEEINLIKTIYKNISYLHQPLLAKLHIIEKDSPDGIKSSDLDKLYKEFGLLNSIFVIDNFEIEKRKKYESFNHETEKYESDKYLIESEFWNRTGNLLYYKNCQVGKMDKCPFRNVINNKNPYRTCSACRKYYDSLIMILKAHGITNNNTFIDIIKDLIENHKNKNFRNIEYKVLAMILSNIGNVNLICSEKEKLDIQFLEKINPYLDENSNVDKNLAALNISIDNKLEIMIFMFLCSAYFYKVSNEHKSAAFQYTCILNFLKEYTSINNFQNLVNINNNIITSIEIEDCAHHLAYRAIKSIYCSYDHIHNYEINSFKTIFYKQKDKKNYIPEKIALKRASVNTDLDEINIAVEHIRLNLNPTININNNNMFYLYNLVSPFCLNSNMYNRILKLQLRAKMNLLIFTDNLEIPKIEDYSIKEEKIINSYNLNAAKEKPFFGEIISCNDLIEFLISDSIFCYSEIIKLFSTFDRSFHFNYSLLAESHSKLLIWTIYYNLYCKYKKDKNLKIIKDIENLIEPDNLRFISKTYQCEKAINAYYAMKATHQQGQAYKNLIENMYYLNDDFNDDLYHFSVAIERYKINKGIVDEEIKKLKMLLKNSDLYQHKNYINEELITM